MSGRPPSPPRGARLLARITIRDERWREVALGDLGEEFDAVASDRGLVAARLWYWRQVVALTAERATDALRAFTRPSGDRFMSTLLKEARLSLRSLARQPLIAGVVLLTLALGLGVNAATFGMIDSLLLRPFTIPNVDRLVLLSENSAADPYPKESVSPANFFEWRHEAQSFSRLVALVWWDVNLSGGDQPERLQGHRVSPDFFAALGVSATMGRTLRSEDEIYGRHQQVVISDGLWQRRFGGGKDIVGRIVRLDGTPYEVVGVAQRGFDFPVGTEVWAPLALAPEAAANRAQHYLTVFGELKPAVSIEQASSEMAAIYARQQQKDPPATVGRGLVVRTFTAGMVDYGMPNVMALWQAAAALVLLMGCTNIASLLLARGTERRRELAVRLAIGASRAQLVRQLLVESLLLALLAIPAALGVAWLVLGVLRSAMPASLVRFVTGWMEMGISWRVIAYTVLAAVVTSVIFGLLPALHSSRLTLTSTLREGGRSSTSRRSRLRRGLVVAEIALALPLLVASGLAAIAGQRFVTGNQGYNPDGVFQMRTVLAEVAYPDAAARARFVDRLLEEARKSPGVQSVATASIIPAISSNQSRVITIDGVPDDPRSPRRVNYRAASPRYFETLQIPLVAGRDFTALDRTGTEKVSIVSEAFVRQHLQGGLAIGRRIRVGTGDEQWTTIVGVSADTVDDWFTSRRVPTVFVPIAQFPSTSVAIVARTSGDPAALAPGLRAALAAVDSAQPAFNGQTMNRAIRERTTGLRLIGAFMASVGALALFLAAFGIYGVMANHVNERRHEIGLRMALGATRADVLRMTIGNGARLTAIGLAIGLVASLGLARLMETALFGIVAIEPSLFVAITLTLATVAVLSSALPARRATQVDPAVALRNE